MVWTQAIFKQHPNTGLRSGDFLITHGLQLYFGIFLLLHIIDTLENPEEPNKQWIIQRSGQHWATHDTGRRHTKYNNTTQHKTLKR